MKTFGPSVDKPKTVTEQIVDLTRKVERTRGRLFRKRIHIQLHALCLENPSEAAGLAFGDTLNEKFKTKVIFSYSMDHGGSCSIKDNLGWSRMMNKFIIKG